MAIIGMGRSLKLKVIAEGVETPMQADFLKLNGCDEVQGYYYGEPMEAGELALLLEAPLHPRGRMSHCENSCPLTARIAPAE